MENENQRGPRFHTFYSNSFEVLEKIFFQMAERDRKNLAKDQNGSAFPGLFTPIILVVLVAVAVAYAACLIVWLIVLPPIRFAQRAT